MAFSLYQLGQLMKVMNFGQTAHTVFERLILGERHGLLVLWGGMPGNPVKANKGFFLNLVESFENGAVMAKMHLLMKFPGLWRLLDQLQAGHYQCVRLIEDCPVPHHSIYETPLAVAVPLAITGAARRRGLSAGRNVVVLCDDLQRFMEHNRAGNEQYLRDLAASLDEQNVFTFLGASQLVWDAKAVLGPGRALPLGWD